MKFHMQVNTIAEQLFFTTVRIDTITTNGIEGSGTGFFFSYKRAEQTFLFIVTNKHVVMDMREGRLCFLQGKNSLPTLGSGFRLGINDWIEAWFGHPSSDIDIAICPLAPLETNIKNEYGVDLFYRCISNDMIPTSQQIAELDALEPVTFIGYPNGIWDSKNLLPVARKGVTASPIEVDFEGTPRFLIDASVFGGSSGSPVFILNHGSWADKKDGMVIGSRFHFVGVISSVFVRKKWNEIVAIPIPTLNKHIFQNEEMIDLGIVLKARIVIETIEAYLKKCNIT